MTQVTVMLTLDRHVLKALDSAARADGSDPATVIRDAIRRDLYRRSRAKKADRPDERLVAPLRALLADDLAYARDWDDLAARLSAKGYALREAGAGLALFELNGNRRLAKASDLGASYGRLMRRFGAPMPGHSHRYLYDRLAGR
ncbi:hypothetical protein P1J78_16455 [Psychromarinibacter sp. C21-152]|uniref:Ribbon-helix-helix protein, copG family n=1 Tax=Psychromarinibacter sediminicola TaxID=3033385 RepID=A0AAE3T9L1_9RHOB|nr:hypothetical protein [Psychromarinibacter sediminicola]MDF0602332.1 hypothetical protein [Psychromarinibacter sediminicola]